MAPDSLMVITGCYDRWSMEAVLGIGWAHLDYDKYPCATCGTVLKKRYERLFRYESRYFYYLLY